MDFSYGGEVQNIATSCLNESSDLSYQCQVGASRQGKAKNLASVQIPTKSRPAGATTANTATNKGKMIDFLWWAEKQGYAKQTIRSFGSCLRALLYREADLLNPESVKEALAREKKWSQNRRRNVINTYTTFLRFNGMKWEKPKCRVEKKIPFIPMEKELDALIAGSNRKLAAFLQVLKETAMRSGEAKSIMWSNIDFERHLIILNAPEKGSNPRIFRISQELVDMLNALPKTSEQIFPNKSLNSLKVTYIQTRKRLAQKLQNPRLLKISFHTIRHWKATVEYHKTKDILYVKNLLGHKKLENTKIYITLEKAIFGDPHNQEFHVKVGSTSEEIKALLEVGFEYICDKEGLMFFRKRK